MKKFLFLFAAAMMTTIALTSCDIETSSGDDGNPEEHHEQIANTGWQLTEVMNQNNEWVAPEFYPGFDIPKLSFGYSNSYFMRICTSNDRTDVMLINGGYSVDKYFSISMTIDNYQGIAYTLKVTSLNDNLLEGEFTIWGKGQRAYETASERVATTYTPRHYTIRMKRIGK